jgi:hypothetical protein
MKMDFYYANVCKHEHEKNMTRLWRKIMFKINVEQIEGNKGSYFYVYTPLGPSSRNLPMKLLRVHRINELL